MILLSGHSLTPERRVPLEALSLELKERESTANMTPADMTGISVNSWFKDDVEPGAGIVWRVKSLATTFQTETPTVQLEHVINTLRDKILFGEVTAATITGSANAERCTAEQAVRYILRQQGDWVLGTFGYSVSNPYKFDGETLFDALEIVTNSLLNACWTYDLTVYPFKLNIVPIDTSVDSELRAGRNLTAITRTIDKSALYTRFFPIGYDDLHIDGDCVQKNVNLYGAIDHVETDTSIESKSELVRWANERLENHCEPTVTIEVEGFELASATGESLDRLTLGRVCRVPLPEYGTTIQERIVALSYPDKVHQPEVFKATLANNRNDVTKIIADAIKGGVSGKGGRTSAKQSKEDHAWIEDTEDHVALCAESIIGEGDDMWRRLSEIVVDGEGIHQRVTRNEGDIVTAFTQIDMNEQRILLEAQRATAAEGQLSGRITVEADRITQEVTQRKKGEEELASRIIVTAREIRQEVSASKSTLFSVIMQTATNIYTQVGNAKSDTYSKIEQTASSIRSDVWAAKSTLFSSIMQTATNIYTQVGNAKSDTYSKIEQTASSIRSDIYAAKSTLFSSIMQTATNIYTQVGNAKSDTYSKIEQTASSIRSDVSSAKSSLWSSIVQTSTQIALQVASAKSDTFSAIKVNSDNIELKVSKDGVISSINQSAEQISINASKINLNGYVKASDITADLISSKIAAIATMTVQNISSARGGIDVYTVKTTSFEMGGVTCYLPSAIWNLQITLSGNTYTLQRKRFNDEDWTDVGSFSRATTLSGAWSSGKFTVSAAPQGNTYWTDLVQGSTTWDGNNATVPVEAIDSTSGGNQYATGRSIFVDASARYTAGWEDYYDSSYWQAPSGSNSWACKIPKKDKSGSETWFSVDGLGIFNDAEPPGQYAQSVPLSYGQTINMWAGVTVGGNRRWGRQTTVTAPSAPTHTISSTFDTTNASPSEPYNGLTNGADGYGFNNAGHAFIVTKSTWKCDGVAREHLSYLWDAAENLYQKGVSDGQSSVTSLGSGWHCTRQQSGDEYYYTLSKTVAKNASQPAVSNNGNYHLYKG